MNIAQKSFRRRLGENWFFMTTAPWERIEMTDYNRRRHIFTYTIGWLWILSGIIVGSLLSQPLLDKWQLRNTIWETPISIGIAVGVGFLVQFVGWLLLIPILTRKKFRVSVGVVGVSSAVVSAVGAIGIGVVIGIGAVGAIGGVVGGVVGVGVVIFVGIVVGIVIFVIFVVIGGVSNFVSNLFDIDNGDGGAYAIGVLFPIVLSVLCIYILFHYFRANYDFDNKTVLYSVFVKAIIYPAIGKVLAVIGFGHFFTGIKTAIKVYEE